ICQRGRASCSLALHRSTRVAATYALQVDLPGPGPSVATPSSPELPGRQALNAVVERAGRVLSVGSDMAPPESARDPPAAYSSGHGCGQTKTAHAASPIGEARIGRGVKYAGRGRRAPQASLRLVVVAARCRSSRTLCSRRSLSVAMTFSI